MTPARLHMLVDVHNDLRNEQPAKSAPSRNPRADLEALGATF